MNFEDQAICFECGKDLLYGVLSMPEKFGSRGVLILVGGGQYRVGSHRQFTLLARYLASNGIPVMRFDFSGMGDSEGERRAFDQVDDEISCALDHFAERVPGMTDAVIWGLCDAASAALFYAHQDARVKGLVLLNPWVRTEAGIAKAYLRHYYLSRIFDSEMWRKVLRGRFDAIRAGRSLWTMLRTVFNRGSSRKFFWGVTPSDGATMPLPDRMLDAYMQFSGQVLLILSGNDLTAREFSDLAAADGKWRALMMDSRTRCIKISDANHTFSTKAWRNQVEHSIGYWIQSW
jgi:exosortase A-associated hydrolase 1